ncbi:MAG: GH3 auxin-responsive promoter family protein [Bacteroidetes bacterium]|nr:GH3 auxin-responsive promoter family protein [Bacteroidota bacterium]
MSIKSFGAKLMAKVIVKRMWNSAHNSIECQRNIFSTLINSASQTQFGQDHDFENIKNLEDFQKLVPIRDYEGLRPYIEQIIKGKEDVLWPGLPIYFAKTSGTTSGAKYIPITKDSIPNHIHSARNMLLSYIQQTGKADFVDGKMIFLSGSPALKKKGSINLGRLSGIVNHHVPAYLQRNRLPSYTTNCIEDWETKLDKIIDETIDQDMRLISGIPPWVQMYFDRIQERTGKTIKEVFPNFQVLVHGGVNFAPYKAKLLDSIGGPIDILETFPASEGFFAFQESVDEEGLLLTVNSGIFYEFIPLDEFHNDEPTRLPLWEVELEKNYVLIINSNAGLWGYNIGDTVKFVSKNPYKVVVTGRVKHFISAFGEHVIAQEVSDSLSVACEKTGATSVEFTVAPQVEPAEGLPYHEWFIEFEQLPENIQAFADILNAELCKRNTYYNDLITGNILKTAVISVVRKGGFQEYMKSIGKLGGQNKVPKLSNNRDMATKLEPLLVK